ncbi:MAG: 16S rRNA processing protein RimM, partial [Deltaproteobacteria bacterium]|nr:16S rRNA processing protein RimM [Deltaproteobacteria bacterium]MBW2534591.1 16S rRNA processing protein RimM [Deltaproteobacteria bacterium]
AAAEPTELVSTRRVSGGLLVRLPGVDDRDAAEALRGVELWVDRRSLPPTEADEYYVCDLEGCVAHLGGEPFGTIVHVASYPTCDALVIRRPDGSRLEVPMHEDFVVTVRLAERAVDLRTIDGLE